MQRLCYPTFIILLFISSLFSQPLYSQEYIIQTQHFSVEEGLSNRFVYCAIQDDLGFMWFGTKHGLNRYDGYQFKIFTAEKDGLQSNVIVGLTKDQAGMIWVTHVNTNDQLEAINQVDILDPQTLEIQTFDNFFIGNAPLQGKEIKSITKQEDGSLIICTKTGKVFSYNPLQHFQQIYSTDSTTVISKLSHSPDGYWLHSNSQLVHFNTTTLVLDTLVNDSLFKFEQFEKQLIIYQFSAKDRDIPYMFYTYPTTYTKAKELVPLVDTTLTYFDKGGRVKDLAFIQTKHRFELKNTKGEKVYSYKPIYSYTRDVYVDVQGNIWLCSDGEILKIFFTKNKFSYYNKGKSCKAIAHIDSNTLMVAAYEGFSLTTLDNNKIVYPKNHYAFLDYLQDSAAFFWGVKRGDVLVYFEAGKGDVKTYTRKTTEPKLQDVGWSIHRENNKIWIGTNYGLVYLNPEEDFLREYNRYNGFEELTTSAVYQIYVNNNKVWLATSSGLYLLNWETGVQKKYGTDPNATHYIPHNHIQHVHEDKKGILWLATRGGGLIRLNPETAAYRQFLQEDGLSNNLLYAILEANNQLWISSDYGLMRFDKATNLVTTYLQRDGLLHNEFNLKSAYQAASGELFFGGLEGVNAFKPENFTSSKEVGYDVPLTITGYQQFDGKKEELIDLTAKMLQNPEITLKSQDLFFVLQFALLDYTDTKQHRYAYRIEELGKTWSYLTENSLRVNGLSPGEYTLQIKGQGKSGLWSTQQLKIPITVQQPFYKTWQFLLLAIGGLIFIIIVYARWKVVSLRKQEKILKQEVKKRTAQIEKQAQELKELDNLKSKFFTNISHELRTPITLLLGPLEAILDEHYGRDFDEVKKVLEVVYSNGENLQKLVEELLQLSKLDANTLGLQEEATQFFPLINRIQKSFAVEAELRTIQFKFVCNLQEGLTIKLDVKKFEKILNNLLFNALKFTASKGTIWLEVNQLADKKQLKICVKDTGIGIDAADLPNIFNRFYQSKRQKEHFKGGAGIGLALANRLTVLLGGELTVTSQLGKGSVFTMVFPYQETTLKESLEEYILPELPSIETDNTAGDYTILIVEDNKDMRNFIESLLKPTYQTIIVGNGVEAWKLLSTTDTSIDMVLSDVMMPEMDGFELLQRIKDKKIDIPVVLLTALSSPRQKLKGLTIGADDYLTKPFSKKELTIRIKNLLNNYKGRKNWKQEEIVDNSKKVQKIEDVVVDSVWMKEVETILTKQVGNAQFGILELAAELNISDRQLRRRIKKFIGLTPNQYFRLIRLQVARQILEDKQYETLAEVAYHIGFSNPQYFSKLYEEEYGIKPSELLYGK